jgi:hypothetical protein
MGHRHYDSSLGRFLSKDPIGFAGGLNLYSYGNSPVSTVDPDGLDRRRRTWVDDLEIGLARAVEGLGYMEMVFGAWNTSQGLGTMALAPAGGPAAPRVFGAGAIQASGGAIMTGMGAYTAQLGSWMASQAESNDPCHDPMGGISEADAYEAVFNPSFAKKVPKKYHLNNNLIPWKAKFLTGNADEARRITQAGLKNLDEIGFWPNPGQQNSLRAITNFAEDIGTRGERKLRTIIDYVGKKVTNVFPVKNQ